MRGIMRIMQLKMLLVTSIAGIFIVGYVLISRKRINIQKK